MLQKISCRSLYDSAFCKNRERLFYAHWKATIFAKSSTIERSCHFLKYCEVVWINFKSFFFCKNETGNEGESLTHLIPMSLLISDDFPVIKSGCSRVLESTEIKVSIGTKWFNPFVTNVPILYPLENTRKPFIVWCFQGV